MKNAEELLDKYNAGLANAEEIAMVQRWFMNADLDESLPDVKYILDDQLESKKKLDRYMQPKQKFRLWPAISSAAAIVIVTVLALIYMANQKERIQLASSTQRDVAPGGNKAILTLADGREIALTDAGDGTVAEQAGIAITKTKDGQLIYRMRQNGQSSSVDPSTGSEVYNTIATPAGGQYQVILPDGTKVWLNALSSLKYSVTLGKGKQRNVALQGEGYFEVAHDKHRPFIVKTDQQNVEVLGTYFNVNNYIDEEHASTTLIQGSVKVYNNRYSRVIKPGQQAQFESTGQIKIVPVNTEQVVAWKNGVFSFKRAGLETVMRQIARWYNVEVTYEGDVPEISFTGKIYRNVNLQEALRSIGYIGVQYSVENRKVIIKPEKQ